MFQCQPCDWLFFLIGIAFSLLPYYVLFCLLRPELEVVSVCAEIEKTTEGKTRKVLRIAVCNGGNFGVNMLHVEACAILPGGLTLHLMPDLNEFVILPGKKSSDNARVFKINTLHASAAWYGDTWDEVFDQYQQGKLRIRVRVHGLHSLSGLGRATEYLSPAR